MLGISPAQSCPNVTECVRMVPKLEESDGAVGSQLGHDVLGRVLDVMGLFTVPNLSQPLSLGPALPQTPSLPEILNVQSLSQLFVLM